MFDIGVDFFERFACHSGCKTRQQQLILQQLILLQLLLQEDIKLLKG